MLDVTSTDSNEENLTTPLTPNDKSSSNANGDSFISKFCNPFRRCHVRKPGEDRYRAAWFLKAPDLMIRIYQANILFFSFYASAFFVVLRFANDWVWLFFVVYPTLILFGFGYRLFAHYAAVRYMGTLTLDSALGMGGRGWTNSSSDMSRDNSFDDRH